MMKTKYVLLVCTFCVLFLTSACAFFTGTDNKENKMNFNKLKNIPGSGAFDGVCWIA